MNRSNIMDRILSGLDIGKFLKDKRLREVSEITGISYPTILSLRDDPHLKRSKLTLKKMTDFIEEYWDDILFDKENASYDLSNTIRSKGS